MTTDIERKLTAALAAAAERIEWGTEAATADPPASRRPRRKTWLVSAGAAAVIAAVAALATGLRHDPRPAAPNPTPDPSVTSRSTPKPTPTSRTVVNGLHAATCRLGYAPSSWETVFVRGSVTQRTPAGGYDSAGLPILALDAAGEVLAAPAASPAPLTLIRRDRSTTELYRAPVLSLAQGGPATVGAASLDADWAAFAVKLGAGQGALRQLGVVDRSSGKTTIFRALPNDDSADLSAPVLFDGRIYWTEIAPSGGGTVNRYDPTTGRTVVLAHVDGIGNLTALGGGLYWENHGRLVVYHRGNLPAGFVFQIGKVNNLDQSPSVSAWDGYDYSAATPRSVIRISRGSMRTPLIAYTAPVDSFVQLLAVAGPLVIWDDGTSVVALDSRTGATTKIEDDQGQFTTARADGDTVALNYIGSKGGAQLQVVRWADLPELHC